MVRIEQKVFKCLTIYQRFPLKCTSKWMKLWERCLMLVLPGKLNLQCFRWRNSCNQRTGVANSILLTQYSQIFASKVEEVNYLCVGLMSKIWYVYSGFKLMKVKGDRMWLCVSSIATLRLAMALAQATWHLIIRSPKQHLQITITGM